MSEETLKVQIYAALHQGNDGDVAFYENACLPEHSVLELGCGSGRIMAALAANATGRRVGLDLSINQLALAKANVGTANVHWVHADMSAFEMPQSFDRIIIPYNGLYTLSTDAQMIACLASARRHLEPDGRILFDTYAVTDVAMETHIGPDEPELLAELEVGPYDVAVWESERPVNEPRSIEVVYRYDLFHRQTGAELVLHDAIMHHFLRPRDLRAVIQRAGLRLVRLDGNFTGETFHEDAEHYVVTAAPRLTR